MIWIFDLYWLGLWSASGYVSRQRKKNCEYHTGLAALAIDSTYTSIVHTTQQQLHIWPLHEHEYSTYVCTHTPSQTTPKYNRFQSGCSRALQLSCRCDATPVIVGLMRWQQCARITCMHPFLPHGNTREERPNANAQPARHMNDESMIYSAMKL